MVGGMHPSTWLKILVKDLTILAVLKDFSNRSFRYISFLSFLSEDDGIQRS